MIDHFALEWNLGPQVQIHAFSMRIIAETAFLELNWKFYWLCLNVWELNTIPCIPTMNQVAANWTSIKMGPFGTRPDWWRCFLKAKLMLLELFAVLVKNVLPSSDTFGLWFIHVKFSSSKLRTSQKKIRTFGDHLVGKFGTQLPRFLPRSFFFEFFQRGFWKTISKKLHWNGFGSCLKRHSALIKGSAID